MKLRYLFILLFAISLFSACNRNKKPVQYFDQEFLDYVDFPDGSYWMYVEDGAPWQRDIMQISNYSRGVTYDPDWYDGEIEAMSYNYTVRGVSVNSLCYVWYPEGFYGDEDFTPENVYLEIYRPSGSELQFFYVDGDTSCRFDMGVTIVSRTDSMEFNGVMYYDLITVRNNGGIAGVGTYEQTRARNIGIVNRKFTDGSSWSLKEYYIPD